jgi:hypothetical protein
MPDKRKWEGKPRWRQGGRRVARLMPVAGAAGLLLVVLPGLVPGANAAQVVPAQVQVSHCPGQNAEVEQAVDGRYVYELWIGCRGIGFARSTDRGARFGPSITVPGSTIANAPRSSAWDPAITVGRGGAVYAAFMVYDSRNRASTPVVAASFDHGVTFPQFSVLPIPKITDPNGNWGDRDFIAVAPSGKVYVTWDYGPSATEVKYVCSPTGSCGFSAGDLNAVVQTSSDSGKTWTSLRPISPGFPAAGADSAPILVQPDGTVDVLYQGYLTAPATLRLSDGHEYFSRSTDGGRSWSAPVVVGGAVGTMNDTEWWIDGDLSIDGGDNLYATWDTQSPLPDEGWVSTSSDGGRHWSRPVAPMPAHGTAEQLTEVSGGLPGQAWVAWQTPATPQGYATYLRAYSMAKGWLGPATQVSTSYGNPKVWPGDTFGITFKPAPLGGPGTVTLSWGSAIAGHTNSEIYATVVPAKS